MFNNTWKWAGEFRKSEKNIGINWLHIPVKIKELCEDVHYQFDHKTYSKREIAVRFHHRLVKIHAFSNGNGRHARLIADLLINDTIQIFKKNWIQFSKKINLSE